MQLFELVSPRLFRPLAGPNRAFYAELLLLLWEECRHTADYSISRAEAVSRAEDYFAALAKPLTLDADGAGDEEEQPTRDPHTLALGFLLRLRRTGWLEEQPGSYESEPTLAFVPEVAPLLDALEEILNPRVVTYTGKLYKAWQLLQGVGEEKNPYENVLREVASDLEALNKSLRALNASIGHYIDRLTRNRTPQEVLELFDQYEEKVVAAAYHRFKTSDNLFNYLCNSDLRSFDSLSSSFLFLIDSSLISKRDSFFLASAVFTASSIISRALFSALPILDSAFFFKLETVTK